MVVRVRSHVYVDCMQPQYAVLMAREASASPVAVGMAQIILELDPATEVVRAMDLVLKETNVSPGMLRVASTYGIMEVHSQSRADIDYASRVLQDAYGPAEEQMKPEVLALRTISNIDPRQSELFRTSLRTSCEIAHRSLLLFEVMPACFAALACNEAEKHAGVDVIDMRWSSSRGRAFVCGTEEQVRAAAEAITEKMEGLPGRKRG